MSDRSARCLLCGRLAARLDDGLCSRQCRELADAGYTSPAHPPAALAPPTTAVEARVFIHGESADPLPDGCVEIARLGDRRRIVRVAADDWRQLEQMLSDLRGGAGPEAAEIFTLQQFAPGGLTISPSSLPGEEVPT
jgi:hypothetical protein